MKKILLFFLQCLVLTPCFSQTVGEEVRFLTRNQGLYSGVVTDVATDTFLVQFQPLELSLPLSVGQYPARMKQFSNKPGKEITELGDEVENRLQEAAVNIINQWIQQCSFPESSVTGCCFRFAELEDCSLYLFYTSRGYDFISTDYHIVKIELTGSPRLNPFSSAAVAENVKPKNRHPIVEISKHVNSAVYDEDQFRNKAEWNNQPQYMDGLQFCFVDERKPAFQQSLEQVRKAFDFLYQSCQKRKR